MRFVPILAIASVKPIRERTPPSGFQSFCRFLTSRLWWSLAEPILPGATKASTAEFIDQLLAIDSADNEQQFLKALAAFEGHARLRRNQHWIDLSDAEQIEMLTEASNGTRSVSERANAATTERLKSGHCR